MRKNKSPIATTRSFALLVMLLTTHTAISQPTMSQDASTSHPIMVPANMAPINEYLMSDQAAEIALARTAAPASISRDADIMILGRHGFETAVQGKNGFVCVVERSWTSAADPDFWDPKVRTPICYNAAGARSFLLRNLKRTDLILAGRSKAQVDDAIFAAVDKKELPAMEPGAMCYMMSKQGFGGNTIPHWPAHLMFFYSQTDPATWGANLPGSPILGMSDPREQATSFVVPVQQWSDGTEARPPLRKEAH